MIILRYLLLMMSLERHKNKKMIKFEDRLNNSLNDNVDIDIHASTLYNICKEGIKGFPSINYKFDKAFTNVFNFNDDVDELTAELYMSNLINDLLNNSSQLTLEKYFKDIPEVIIYQLSNLYGLTKFEDLFTKIEANTSIVLPSIWSNYNTTSIKLSDLKDCYGTVYKCYNVNIDTVFKSYFKGDLDDLSNETISISAYDNNIKEGYESQYFKGYLELTSDFISKYASYKDYIVWQNNIYKKELQDTNEIKPSKIITTDNIEIDTVSTTGNKVIQTQYYKMLLETNIKKFIDKFIKDNNLTVTSYNNYPYDLYVYQHPGDSKIIQKDKQTLLIDNKDVFLQNANNINISGYIDCNAWSGSNNRDGQYGQLLNYISISGWKLKDSSYKDKISNLDMITMKNNNFKIEYEFKKDNVKFRKGNIMNQTVYETDKECFVSNQQSFKSFEEAFKRLPPILFKPSFEINKDKTFEELNNIFSNPNKDKVSKPNNKKTLKNSFRDSLSKESFGISTLEYKNNPYEYNLEVANDIYTQSPTESLEASSNDIDNEKYYVSNQYSYGKSVSLNDNPRTACRFVINDTILIHTNKSKDIIQKLGKVALYSFINDCIDYINKYNREMNIVNNLLKYTSEIMNKNISGLFEESPFIAYILNIQNNKYNLSKDEFIERTNNYPLEVSQDKLAKNKLFEIYLPKLEIYGNNIRFCTTNYSDYNRYYIYGDSNYWKIRSIPLKTDNDKMIDNIFIIHNEIFNKSLPNIFNNFDIYS